MWQEWLQQKPRVANSCAEENWSSVPEQYKMLKCVKAALPLIITLLLDRGSSVCCAPGFIQELLDPQCVYSELQQQQCLQHLGWLFYKQLEVVVNRRFFSQWALVEARLELQWNKSMFLLLWAQHIMETSLSPICRAAFLSIHFYGLVKEFCFPLLLMNSQVGSVLTGLVGTSLA